MCVLEDLHPPTFLREVMHRGTNQDVIVPLVKAAHRVHSTIYTVGTDKGYYTPGNRETQDLNAMPKKGRWSAADLARETAPVFVAVRRQHPAAINTLNHRGLSKVRTHEKERTAALSILAASLHRTDGNLRRQKVHGCRAA